MPDKPLQLSTAFPSVDYGEIFDRDQARIEQHDELEISGQQIASVKIEIRTIRIELVNGMAIEFTVDKSGYLGPMKLA